MLKKPYTRKMPSNRASEIRPIKRTKDLQDDPPLTGWVNGLPASDLEERYARGLRRNNQDFSFQVEIATAFTLPRDKKTVDFLIDSGGFLQPTEIYGPLHQWPQAQLEDAEREAELNEVFEQIPEMLPLKIVWFYDLQNQETANKVARNV